MFERARRPVAVGCLLLLALNVSGCYNTWPHPASEATSRKLEKGERIVAVTLHNGIQVEFNPEQAVFVRNDSLHAFVEALQYSVAIADVQRVWIAKVDPVTTTFAVIGVVVGVAAAALVIAVLTKESCPFVYSWDGTQYVFDAEPYGG